MKIVTLTPDKNDERFTITDDSSSTSFETGKSSTDFPSFPGSGVECRKRMRREADNQCMKFLENFDPDRSNREKRKMTQKIEVGSGLGISGGRVYDERGVHIATGLDVCDCMSDGCPGCHFPCPRCRSNKCGHECRKRAGKVVKGPQVISINDGFFKRVNRKWTIESIDVQCKRQEKKNLLLKSGGRQ